MLETVLIALARLTGGRLAEVFFGIGHDGEARICTWSHPIAFYAGDEIPRESPHVHVHLRIWSTGGHATTILSFSGRRMRELMYIQFQDNGPYVLDPSGKPVNLDFTLFARPKDRALPYSPGEIIPVDLQMSRNWVKKVGVRLEAET
jgi:hypothetical protein